VDLKKRELIKEKLIISAIAFLGILFIKENGIQRIIAGLTGDYYDGEIKKKMNNGSPQSEIDSLIKNKKSKLKNILG